MPGGRHDGAVSESGTKRKPPTLPLDSLSRRAVASTVGTPPSKHDRYATPLVPKATKTSKCAGNRGNTTPAAAHERQPRSTARDADKANAGRRILTGKVQLEVPDARAHGVV